MEEVSSLWFPFLQITLAYAKLTERKQKQELQNTNKKPTRTIDPLSA
jgi:flagellar biosynthesis chaperone FliJ